MILPHTVSFLPKCHFWGATSNACWVMETTVLGAGRKLNAPLCRANMPVGIDHTLGEAKLTASCWATSLWIIFISAAWLLSFLSLSFQIDAVIWSHCRNLCLGRYNILQSHIALWYLGDCSWFIKASLMTYNGLVRSQGAGCNFLRFFICINQEFGDCLSLGFLAGSRHHCITSGTWWDRSGLENTAGLRFRQHPDIHNETKISIVLFLQVFNTSVDVKSSKLISLNLTLVFRYRDAKCWTRNRLKCKPHLRNSLQPEGSRRCTTQHQNEKKNKKSDK